MKVGICHPIDPDNLQEIKVKVKDAGADYIEGVFYDLASLEQSSFDKIISYTRDIGLPLRCANAFLGKMNIFDSPEQLRQAEEYVKRSFERFSRTDLRHITFGSGKSRASSESRSIADTKKIFAGFCHRTVAPLARDYGYTVGIEPLNSGETDTYTTAAEAFEFVKELNLPQIRMIVDYFHFTKEKEDPQDLFRYQGYLSHFHIASGSQRSTPLPGDGEEQMYLEFLRAAVVNAGDKVCLSYEGRKGIPFDTSLKYLRSLLESAKEENRHACV